MNRWISGAALIVSFTLAPVPSFSDQSTPAAFDPFHVPGIYWPEWAPYLQSGKGVIEGRFVAKKKLFGEVAFPNTLVDLLPSTALSEWIVRSSGYALEHDDYPKRDPMPHFPAQLNPYERRTMTDDNGYFTFTNLPSGKYYVFGTARHVEIRRPSRYTTEEQTASNGDSVTTLQKTEGLRELSDLITIAASASIDSNADPGKTVIDSFDVMGESTCCKAEI